MEPPPESFPDDEFLNEPLISEGSGRAGSEFGDASGWQGSGWGTPEAGSAAWAARTGTGPLEVVRKEARSGSGRVESRSGSGRSPSQSKRGRQRIGRYEIHRELGRGAFAVVYLAQLPGLERNFALKLLTSSANAVEEARFQREAQIAARLDHPGIVPVLDCGVDAASGRSYLVMEHIPGRTLGERLEREGRLEWPEAVSLIADLAEGIAVAHTAGVLHRDLKPENVLLDARGGRARVCDFGLAHVGGDLEGTLTRAGEAMGTPVYMAPEQASAGETSPQTDVYGLGMILYRALTGAPPYVGASVAETFALVREGGAPAPSRVQEGIPSSVDAVVLSAIHLDPGWRPPSANDLAGRLRACANANTKKRPALLFEVLAVSLALLAVLLGAWALSAEKRARRLATRVSELEATASPLLLSPETLAASPPAPSVALPPEPRRPFLESRRDELAELQRELTRVLDDQVRPSLAPRELLEAQERALPRVAVTRAVRARLLANLGREREALELLARASEDPVPDPTLAAYRVELLLRVSNNKAAIQEGVRRLRAVAQPDTGPEAYFRCVINRRVSPDELVQWTRWSERFDEPYLWAFLAQIEAGNATKRGDAKGLASAAEHWRRYLRLDPGDAIAHFKLSEALYYGHSLTRDPLLIPQINAALRRSRDLVPRPVMWSFVGKSQVTLDQRPRAAIRELREAMRRAEQAGEAGERVRAGGWLVVAYLKAGRDREAEELAAGLRAPYTRGVYRQLRRALPEDLRPRLAELLKEGVR